MVEFRKIIKKSAHNSPGPSVFIPEPVETPEPVVIECAAKQPEPDRSIQDFYLEGLALAAAVLEWAGKDDSVGFPLLGPLDHLIEELIARLDSPETWKLLCMARASSEPSYLPAHFMNVCILATHLALSLRYTPRNVRCLSTVAFLHDTGMARVPDVWNNHGLLTPEEKTLLAPHPIESLKIIDRIGCCAEPAIALAAAEHHERIDGSGYPNSKTAADTSEASFVLSIADVFSAMTHPRLHRPAATPFEAIRSISHDADKSLKIEPVRKFLQIMSLYPIGSYARLNNGLVVKIIAGNDQHLTRPIVQVVSGPAGESPEQDRIIDLKKEKLLFVREPLNLQSLDPVFRIG
jgi:HD-GYP domain-containing protein (c-di-GMP phosphodiesterase class II)